MSESEPPRRKTLSLKSPVAAPGGPPPLERMVKPSARTTVFTPHAAPPPEPPPAPPPTGDWKCKPCGAGFSIEASLADDVVIRCPSCNAKLGTVADFRADPPPTKLRARPTKRA